MRASYETSVWSEIPLENIAIPLLHDEKAKPRRTDIVFEMDDIYESVKRLKDKGVEVSDRGYWLWIACVL